VNDQLATIISYAYVVLVVGFAEIAKRRLAVSSYITRKTVHVAVGTWVLPTLVIFESWRWAIAPPLTFLVVNAIAMRRGSFESIEGDDPRNYGPIFFPAAFVLLLPLFWDGGSKFAAGVGIMCMAWGDPAASIVGRKFGRRKYEVAGSRRSLEGSGAMLVVSLAAALVALFLLGDLGPGRAVLVAACAAAAATVAEAVSFWGADDLTVPLVAAVVAAALV